MPLLLTIAKPRCLLPEKKVQTQQAVVKFDVSALNFNDKLSVDRRCQRLPEQARLCLHSFLSEIVLYELFFVDKNHDILSAHPLINIFLALADNLIGSISAGHESNHDVVYAACVIVAP